MKIIWSIDILSENKKSQEVTVSFLKQLSQKTKLKIKPVYVVRLGDQVSPLTHGEGKKVFLENVKSAMTRWLSGVKLSLEAPLPVLQKGLYLRSDIDALVTAAKKEKADLILVNTHARKGLSRFWMGSFAETLMHHSEVPVLFLNPHSRPAGPIKSLIFPTNLSPESQKALSKVAKLAKSIKAELILYNNIEYFVATPGLSFTETMVFTQNIEKDIEQRRKKLEKTAQKLREKSKIKVKVVVDEKDLRVSEGIQKLAKKTPGPLIVMLSQTGPFLSVLAGSTTRKVVRESSHPVLVLR